MSARATAEDFAAARARLAGEPFKPPTSRRVLRDACPAVPGRPIERRGKRGSRLPAYLQDAIRAGLDAGHSLNSIATDLGVSRNAVRTVRDGFNEGSARRYALRKAVAA